MKKFLLTLITAAGAYGLMAQQAQLAQQAAPDYKPVRELSNFKPHNPNQNNSAQQIGGSRWFSWFETMDSYNGGTGVVRLFAHFKDSSQYLYTDQAGLAPYLYMGTILDPKHDFHQLVAEDGDIYVKANNAYNYDSVHIEFRYERMAENFTAHRVLNRKDTVESRRDTTKTGNVTKITVIRKTLDSSHVEAYQQNIVDTAIVEVFNNNNTNNIIKLGSQSNPNSWSFRVNSTTLRANNIVGGKNFKIPMDQAFFADSTESGTHILQLPVNMATNSGKYVAAGFRFEPGYPINVNTTINTGMNRDTLHTVDSSFNGSDTTIRIDSFYRTAYTASVSVTPKSSKRDTIINTMLLLSMEEVDGATPYYEAEGDGVASVSGVKTHATVHPDNAVNLGWLPYMVPSIAFTPPYAAENHLVSFKLTCNSCWNTDIKSKKVAGFEVSDIYPNPVQKGKEVSLALNLDGATDDIKIDVVNTIGQKVMGMSLDRLTSGNNEVVIRTLGLNSGVYFVNISIDGREVSRRLVISE